MAVRSGLGLTRLVVHAPGRRVDLAVPDRLPLASVLPGLLRHAGEDLADQGLVNGGWVLRRADGAVLDEGTSLAAQRVLDGETLHLVPRRLEWPQTSYDDVVEAIAANARNRGRRWTGEATRAAGLLTGGLAALVILVDLLLLHPVWTGSVWTAAGIAAALLLVGTTLARTAGDATAGTLIAVAAMPFAFVAGLLALADGPLGTLGAPHLLTGCAAATASGILGHAGSGGRGWLFIAGITVGGWGVLGSALAYTPLDGSAAAAAVVTAGLLFSPLLPAVAVRLGRVPLPELPRTPEALVRAEPTPDASTLAIATARTDNVLTGTLAGFGLASAGAFAVLVTSGGLAALLLTATVSLAYLLRSRFYVGVRHRAPLLLTGAGGFVLLAVLPGAVGFAVTRLAIVLPVAAVAAAVGLLAFSVYSRRMVSPRLGRLADLLDVLLTLAVVPLACGVFGLFGLMRGFGG